MQLDFFTICGQLQQVLDFQFLKLGNTGAVTPASVLLASAFLGLVLIFRRRWNCWIIKAICRSGLERRTKKEALLICRYALYPACLFVFLRLLGIEHWLFQQLNELQTDVKAVVDLKLFTIGKTELTLWTIIYLLVLSWLLVRLTGQCETWFVSRILSRTRLESGMTRALGALFRYAVVTLGMIVIIQSAGIDLSALTIMAGGVAVAIGLALQSIMNNVISGLIILFERPIKVGDRIDVGGITGDVARVSLRATTIVTNDNIAMIVPNSEFITAKVINWTYTSRQCRFSFPLRVAADSDPQRVKQLLLQIAEEDKGILSNPEPRVFFEDRTDTALNFSLSVWSSEYVRSPISLRSNLNFAVSQKLTQFGIKVQPAPQSSGNDEKTSSIQQSATSFQPSRVG